MVEDQFWKKNVFFALGTLVDPPLAPTVRGLAGPPAAPSDHWYGGLRVSLGNSEAWKPQKVGGCGWTRCPRNSYLSHVAQDTARSWFRGVAAHCAVFKAFWCLFGSFLEHIVELKGTRGLFDTVKSSLTCSVAIVSLRLRVSPGFGGYFGHLFEHHKWSRITFGKPRFSPIFDALLVPKRPIFKVFWDFPWPKTRHHGLKTA